MPETPHDPETIARVKQHVTQRLLVIPNVVAVGIGPKVVDGQPTGEPAIRVFVRRKLPAEQVPADELIPASIEGVLTDVDVGGPPIPVVDPVDRPGVIDPLDLPRELTTYRPLLGGGRIITVGSSQGGTLGCLMWNPTNHEIGYALTARTSGTAPPHGPWTVQQARNLLIGPGRTRRSVRIPHPGPGRQLTAAFDTLLTDAGVTVCKIPPRSPRANAYAEAVVTVDDVDRS